MLTALARFFRISLSKGSNIIPIGDEIEHARNYLTIQKMRYKNKFSADISVEPGVEKLYTIKLIIQPILENAIYHGMEYADGDGEIHIRAFREQGFYAATDTELFDAFDILYPYDLWPLYEQTVQGKLPLSRLFDAFNFQELSFRTEYNKLRCLENHDQARAAALFPEEAQLLAWTALCFFLKGTTLLYAGQEVCATHTPSLFEKEPIDWHAGRDISAYLAKLAAVKKQLPTEALFHLDTDDAQGIVCGSYIAPAQRAVGVFPLTGKPGTVAVPLADGTYTDALSGEAVTVAEGKLHVGTKAIILL